jgi:hypothetical protein
VLVELAYGKVDEADQLTGVGLAELEPSEHLGNGRYVFTGAATIEHSGAFGYTVRVIPRHDGLASKAELGLVVNAGSGGHDAHREGILAHADGVGEDALHGGEGCGGPEGRVHVPFDLERRPLAVGELRGEVLEAVVEGIEVRAVVAREAEGGPEGDEHLPLGRRGRDDHPAALSGRYGMS